MVKLVSLLSDLQLHEVPYEAAKGTFMQGLIGIYKVLMKVLKGLRNL